jgi:membrane protein
VSGKTEAIRDDLAQIGGDVRGLADALRSDPRVDQRKELGWRVLYGGIAVGATVLSRRLAARTWGVLTGEGEPVTGRSDSAATPVRPSEPTVATAPHEPEPETPTPTAAEERAYEESAGRPLPDEAPQPQPERDEPKLADPRLTDLSRRDWVAVFKRAGKETRDDNIPMIASALAYSSFFAIPSVLLVAVGVFTLVVGPDTIDSLMRHFSTVVPGEASSLLNGSLTRLNESPSSGIVMTIVGFVLAVWATTGAMTAYMTALNIAYDRKDRRSFLRKRLVAVQMAAAIGFAFVLIAVLLIFGPTIESWLGRTLGIESVLGWIWWVAQWPLLVAGLLAAFATTYWLGPDVDHPRWRFLTVGSAVAVAMWLAASGLFAVYTSTFASYNKTWGSLSAVIVMLTWLWLTGIALLFGAEVNAEIERSRELRKGEPAERELRAPHAAGV